MTTRDFPSEEEIKTFIRKTKTYRIPAISYLIEGIARDHYTGKHKPLFFGNALTMRVARAFAALLKIPWSEELFSESPDIAKAFVAIMVRSVAVNEYSIERDFENAESEQEQWGTGDVELYKEIVNTSSDKPDTFEGMMKFYKQYKRTSSANLKDTL